MANPNTQRDRSDLAARTAPIVSDGRSALDRDATDAGFQHIAPDAAKNVIYAAKQTEPETNLAPVIGADGIPVAPTAPAAEGVDTKAYALTRIMGMKADASGQRVRHEYKIEEVVDEADLVGLTASVHYRRGPRAIAAIDGKGVKHGVTPPGAKGVALTLISTTERDEEGNVVLDSNRRPKRLEFKVGDKLPARVLKELQYGSHYA
jgi:hypothetical protein